MKNASMKTIVVVGNIAILLVLFFQGMYSYSGSSKIQSQSGEINSKFFPSLQLINQFSFQVEQLKPIFEEAAIEEDEDILETAMRNGSKADRKSVV